MCQLSSLAHIIMKKSAQRSYDSVTFQSTITSLECLKRTGNINSLMNIQIPILHILWSTAMEVDSHFYLRYIIAIRDRVLPPILILSEGPSDDFYGKFAGGIDRASACGYCRSMRHEIALRKQPLFVRNFAKADSNLSLSPSSIAARYEICIHQPSAFDTITEYYSIFIARARLIARPSNNWWTLCPNPLPIPQNKIGYQFRMVECGPLPLFAYGALRPTTGTLLVSFSSYTRRTHIRSQQHKSTKRITIGRMVELSANHQKYTKTVDKLPFFLFLETYRNLFKLLQCGSNNAFSNAKCR